MPRAKKPRKRGKCKPNGAFNIPELPLALVMDILSRLSINTLCNCRCVCKDWLHMISDPQFAHLHRLRSPISILIKTSPRARDQSRLDLIHVEKNAGSRMRVDRMRFAPQNSIPCSLKSVRMINSCNGFICLSESRSLYVCNPILGQYISIPSSVKSKSYVAYFFAIGFSAKTKEYKVMQTIVKDYNWNEAEVMIYTIGTGVWRSLGKPPCRLSYVAHIPFYSFLHGALHWVSVYFNCPQLIQSFDFDREEFRPLLPPASLMGFNYYDGLELGVLKDCIFLCVFAGILSNDSTSDMWVMKDYGVQESWTKIFVLQNLYPTGGVVDAYVPIMFVSDLEILMTYKKRSVVHYNHETKSLQKTRIVQTQSAFQALGYSPCFVSLHDVSNGEEVKRIRDNNQMDSLLGKASTDSASSSVPPAYKSRELN